MSCHERGTKKNSRVPDRIRTYDLIISSHYNSRVNKHFTLIMKRYLDFENTCTKSCARIHLCTGHAFVRMICHCSNHMYYKCTESCGSINEVKCHMVDS